MERPRIPNAVAAVVGEVLARHYYTHQALNTLFMEKGAPGDPPEGNCAEKATRWLMRANDDPTADAFAILGGVLEELMEVDNPGHHQTRDRLELARSRIREVLARHGLSYHQGGRVLGAGGGAATRSLESVLRDRDLATLGIELQRALTSVEVDPPTCITAACSIIEALCKVYIDDEKLTLPKEQSIKPLWRVVQDHLGLDPASIPDQDVRRLLSGITSIVDGLGALRTHTGSAHGRGRTLYELSPRHARLALNAAHTLAVFVLETWDAQKEPNPPT